MPPTDRPRPAAGPARRLTALALAGALLAGGLAGCGGGATESVDCDQALSEKHYDTVLKHCDNPFQIASAYLGKAGFDTFELVNSTAPAGKVAGLLGLTSANVNEKRVYINLALDAVKKPDGGNQAFALLIASFLGLAVTSEQFLDNGIADTAGTVDSTKVLDDVLEPSETQGAIGFTTSTPALTLYTAPATQQYSVTYGGKSYVLDCTGDPTCVTNGGNHVYDDTTGSGLPDSATPSADEATVLADVANVTSAGYVVQVAAINTGLGLSAATQEPVNSFLGQTSATGTFDIGVGGYLVYLHIADAELAVAAGSSGGTDVTDQIDAITDKLDNGATCTATDATLSTALVLTNEFYAIYAQAAGTVASPVSGTPGAGTFAAKSLVSSASLPDWPPAPLPAAITFPALPAGTAFPLTRYKFIFPTAAGLGAFDATQATARIDQTPSAFQTEFENIPVFAPAASTAKDGTVTVMEILCSSD